MNTYRHGDLIFTQLDSLPEGIKCIDDKAQSFTLALGEVTGHKHVMQAEKTGDMRIYKDSRGRYVIEVGAPTKLSHEEHDTLTFKPGIYLMDNEREFDYFEQAQQQVLD